ncbi:MarR family transcriptional regulator [Allobaculum stercoricanis]|uniref:MarR family winged helix-turn-helix transcriptional regulator n=1 Tax=Allobaculum stercoricanis TaxID=174709 RepID=UPI0029426437|nr:MarR family transcriptional regulator [Allobaculum stercoricanis]
MDISAQQNKPHVSFLIGSLQHIIRTKIDNQLRAEDLTKTQFDVLVFLQSNRLKNREIIQKDLQAHFKVSNPTISSLLDRLEAKNLIQRVVSKNDRRIHNIELTQLGIEQLENVRVIIDNAEEAMLKGLSHEEIESGTMFLQTIVNNLLEKEVLDCDFHSSQTD